ncbi:MAG TPA: hypothetical protein VGC19_12290 [Rhodanobacter sp.]
MSLAPVIALATSVPGTVAFYAASPNCPWAFTRRWRRWSMALAAALSVLSLGAWIVEYGVGVGLCAMLGAYMLTLVVLPWLALLTSSSSTAVTEPEND